MPEILFPVLTGLTLVFAGILVGYFLWFRDRSEQLMLSENLSTENERLTAELRAKTSQCVDHEDHVSRLGLKNTSLEQLCNDLLSSREKIQLQTNDLESELISSRKKLDEIREQMTEECRLRSKSEENLLGAKQQYVDALAKIELDWKDKFASSQNSLFENNSEVARLTSANEQLAERLHSADKEVAELKSELSAHREILETAKTNAAGLEKEYVTLETSMRSQIELLSEARGQTAAAVSAKKLAEDSAEQRREQSHALQLEIQKLQSELLRFEKTEDRCVHLESSLEVSKERLEALVSQRDEALDQRNKFEQEITGLQTRSENQQATISQLRGQAEEGEQHHKRTIELTAQMQQLEQSNRDLVGERDQLTQRFTDSEKQHQQHEAAMQRVSEENEQLMAQLLDMENVDRIAKEQKLSHEHTLGRVSEENARLLAQLQNLENVDRISQEQQGRYEAELKRITEENAQLAAQLEELQGIERISKEQQDRYNEELKRISAENAQLLAQLRDLENEDRESKQFADDYKVRIDSVLQQRDLAFEEVAELKAQIRRVRNHAKTNEETIRILRRERGQILMRNRQMPTSFPRIHNESLEFSKADQLAQEYGGKIETDPVRGLLFSEAPRERDDLKLIYGVAEILEQRLNGFGIYTFKQLMEWDEKAIVEFSELLTFKDRIHRDDWLGQAATLYYQKKNLKATAA